MWLELAHPAHAALSCADCGAFWYDRDAKCVERGGARERRPPASRPPCETCPKIPPGAPPVPASAVELTEGNRRCWEHYRECKAVGWRVPDAADPVVRRNARLLADAERRAAEDRGAGDLLTLGRLLRGKARE